MTPLLRLAIAAGAALTTAGISGAAIRAAGPVDRPRDRGSHLAPTTTSGGLGVIAALAVGLLVLGQDFSGAEAHAAPSLTAFVLAAALGAMGALDDLFDLPARPKLLIQGLAALLFTAFGARVEAISSPFGAASLGPLFGALGSALWIVVVVNAVNFMDGVNGLAAGACLLMLTAAAAACHVAGREAAALLAILAAAGLMGFCPWNFPKARLFQGDAGSLFTGFILAAVLLIAPGPGAGGRVPLLFGPTLLTPFLTDVLLTLVRRARRRARLLDAHAEHLYQRWFAAHGRRHAAVTLRVLAIIGLYSVLALGLLATRDPGAQWTVFGAGVAVAVGAWLWLSARLDHRR